MANLKRDEARPVDFGDLRSAVQTWSTSARSEPNSARELRAARALADLAHEWMECDARAHAEVLVPYVSSHLERIGALRYELIASAGLDDELHGFTTRAGAQYDRDKTLGESKAKSAVHLKSALPMAHVKLVLFADNVLPHWRSCSGLIEGAREALEQIPESNRPEVFLAWKSLAYHAPGVLRKASELRTRGEDMKVELEIEWFEGDLGSKHPEYHGESYDEQTNARDLAKTFQSDDIGMVDSLKITGAGDRLGLVLDALDELKPEMAPRLTKMHISGVGSFDVSRADEQMEALAPDVCLGDVVARELKASGTADMPLSQCLALTRRDARVLGCGHSVRGTLLDASQDLYAREGRFALVEDVRGRLHAVAYTPQLEEGRGVPGRVRAPRGTTRCEFKRLDAKSTPEIPF